MINGMMVYAERFWNGGEGSYDELVDFENKMVYHKENLLQNHDVRWNPNIQTLWNITIADTIKLEARGG